MVKKTVPERPYGRYRCSDGTQEAAMLTITPLSPRAVEIVAEGHFGAPDIAPALDRMTQLLDEMPRMDVLADVRGSPSIGCPRSARRCGVSRWSSA
jgi:hypothetical protein